MAFTLKSLLLFATLFVRYSLLAAFATIYTRVEYYLSRASKALLGRRYSMKRPTSLLPEVTCEWLTQVMRESKLIGPHVKVDKIDTGSNITRGMCGKMGNARVSYSTGENAQDGKPQKPDLEASQLNQLPSSILIKTTRPVFANRKFELIHQQGREILIYQMPHLFLKQPDSNSWPTFKIPQALFVETRPWLTENVLVLEDIRQRPMSVSKVDPHLSRVTINIGDLLGFADWGDVAEPHPDLPKFASTVQGRLMVLETLFERSATLHGYHWCNVKGLKSRSRIETGCAFSRLPQRFRDVLNEDQWIFDDMQDRWDLVQASCYALWKDVKKLIKLQREPPQKNASQHQLNFKFSAKLEQIIDNSFAYSTWENFKKEVGGRARTLNHGDFHGANMMAQIIADKNLELLPEGKQWWNNMDVFLFDWSELREWTPMADMAEILIVDTDPKIFKHTKELVQNYHQQLCKAIVAAGHAPDIEAAKLNYPFENCWTEFSRASIERWIFILLVYCKHSFGPPRAANHLHDQMLQFIEAHGDYDRYLIVSPVSFLCP